MGRRKTGGRREESDGGEGKDGKRMVRVGRDKDSWERGGGGEGERRDGRVRVTVVSDLLG